jgi:hypothetical protein
MVRQHLHAVRAMPFCFMGTVTPSFANEEVTSFSDLTKITS